MPELVASQSFFRLETYPRREMPERSPAVKSVRDGEDFRVLVVDDERHIVDFLKVGLTHEGFSVAEATSGLQALNLVATFKPHVVILDLMLPGIDGIEVAQRLRANPDLLIIMLTARDRVEDRIVGLEAGADDYLVKPFAFEELLARIKAVARRQIDEPGAVLRAGQVVLDDARRVVTMNGEEIELTVKEFDLLKLFMLNIGRVLPRSLILDRVWGYDFYGTDNNVEVYVGYLRRKLGDAEHSLIETVRGVGYRMNV